MPRGFSEQERQVITNSLIEQGRILFSKLGFQKTSILEITKNVGIAQGTFYKFFHSKEELFFVILEMEEQKIREQFLNIEVCREDHPKKTIKIILKKMIHTIETNPLIRELYIGSNMEEMVKRLSPELLEKHFMKDSNALLTLVEKWRSLGIHVKEDPTVIAGLLRSLFVLTLHEKEIGTSVYKETMNLFVDLIVDGLIKEE
ncbi:TetR/AcrR family transcriptional regulator [Paenibacillus nasutitermitis]|uniref:HTH tetR-type domain-containing protein n=1 Tax=Paenibacillus nasutitermitis TaxID=1652958 RepID=A0A916ZFV1_9BACL|nr:TetR/AcrR family transcriptional regulator [Paenibacillus nasutitermitis]GGD93060.1 hypothetical protein GCM10010911_59560 [Paenibacillus nasutitermitis]